MVPELQCKETHGTGATRSHPYYCWALTLLALYMVDDTKVTNHCFSL